MRVVIVGAGGHGTVVADILWRMREAGQDIEPVAFVDDQPPSGTTHILSVPVVAGGHRALPSIDHDAVVVAIGSNTARRAICEDLIRAGVLLVTARHPSAVIARDVTIGPGTMICAGAVINPTSTIGIGAIINTASSIDHHNRIGDYVHVAPGCHFGGAVTVGNGALIGIGATIVPGRHVGAWSVVGAGSVVTKDIPDDTRAIGVPARIR